uniref:Uncharacterized protein n=1 Tax=Pseudomonas savastanoi pv. phaseolicola TaxID=319 RepID=Q4LBK5_PSESH|nr:hypothetical protein [Pseudomonas savastanoi pv. phaseolicola]
MFGCHDYFDHLCYPHFSLAFGQHHSQRHLRCGGGLREEGWDRGRLFGAWTQNNRSHQCPRSMRPISLRSRPGWVMPISARPRSTIGGKIGLRIRQLSK